jgi:hypothetical protein
MNSKSSWVLLALIGIAILFVPLVPNDIPLNCNDVVDSCDDQAGYVSLYSKYISK